MYVAEFTLHAKPGHFEQVAEIYSQFAADFLSEHPALQTVLVLGDEASGVVRGSRGVDGSRGGGRRQQRPRVRVLQRPIGPLLASPTQAGRATAPAPLLALGALGAAAAAAPAHLTLLLTRY